MTTLNTWHVVWCAPTQVGVWHDPSPTLGGGGGWRWFLFWLLLFMLIMLVVFHYGSWIHDGADCPPYQWQMNGGLPKVLKQSNQHTSFCKENSKTLF